MITDLKMPRPAPGFDLVRSIKHSWPETLMLVITAHGTVETAVEAMRSARDYLAKPVDLDMLGPTSARPMSITCSAERTTCFANAWPPPASSRR